MLAPLPDEYWSLAERYIALDTSIAVGNAAIEPLLREALMPLQPRIHVQTGMLAGKAQVNVLASWGPDTSGGLLLVTHSDTVLPGPLSRWTDGPPHQLTRKDDRVIGLGTADVKLDYLCKLFALRALDLTQLKKPLHLLATYGEEVGLQGAKAFVAAGWCKPEWVLCGEPSELVPCHAHKGYAMRRVRADVFRPSRASAAHRLTMHGRSAHSSTPALGKNAITALVEALPDAPLVAISGGGSPNTIPAEAVALCAAPAQAEDLRVDGAASEGFDLRPALSILRSAYGVWGDLVAGLEPMRDAEFQPDTAVHNWNVLQAEPTALTATFDARLLPGQDPDVLHARFTEAIGKAGAGVTVAATIERSSPGMRLDRNDPLLRALCDAAEAEPKAKATSTEAGVFFHRGMSACVFGPGPSVQNAHCPNEFNRVSDLERATAVYQALVRKLCF